MIGGVNSIVSNFEVTVEKLVYGGEGLARLDGRVVLAPFVLPGERVRARARQEKPGLVRADDARGAGGGARARGRAVPLLRPLRRLPLPARALRISARAEAAHSGRGVAAAGEDGAAGEIAVIAGGAVGLSQPRATAHRRRADRIPGGALAQAVRHRPLPHRSPKINEAIAALARMTGRPALAAVRAVARSLHRRAPGAAERARYGKAGGAAILRVVRGGDRRAGDGRAGLRRPLPGERQLVFSGEPLSDRPSGGSGDGRRGTARRRWICMRGWDCSRCRWRGNSAR